MRQREQGVSMVGFLAPVVILAVLLVGGVYAVRHSSWFNFGATNSDTSSQPEKSSSDTKKSTKSSPNSTEKRSSTSGDTSTKSQSESSDSSSNSSSSEKQDSASNDSTSQSTPQQTKSSDDTSSQPATNSTADSNLPHTGPADTAASLLGAILLAGAVSTYIISRRERQASL